MNQRILLCLATNGKDIDTNEQCQGCNNQLLCMGLVILLNAWTVKSLELAQREAEATTSLAHNVQN